VCVFVWVGSCREVV